MSEPLISVIVPVYNAGKYLDVCIKSLVLQTYKNLELIFVNDGSLDNSLKILKKWEKKDSRIKILNQNNKGAASARNSAVLVSRGEYVSFIDADDYVSLALYDKFLNLSKKAGVMPDIFCFNMWLYYEKKNIDSIGFEGSFDIRCWQNRKNEATIHKFIDCTKPFSGNLSACNKIFKKSFLIENKIFFPKGLVIEDFQFAFFALLNAKTILLTNDYLYTYRKDVRGSVTKSYGKKIFNVFEINKNIEDELRRKKLFEIYKYAFFQHKFNQYIYLFFQTEKVSREKFYAVAQNDIKLSLTPDFDIEILNKLKGFNRAKEFLALDCNKFFEKYKNNVVN